MENQKFWSSWLVSYRFTHNIEVELKPGESKDFILRLGYVENKEDEKVGV